MSAIGKCLWCGGETITKGWHPIVFVECQSNDCMATGPARGLAEEAITAWNRLATPDPERVTGRVRWERLFNTELGSQVQVFSVGKLRVGSVWKQAEGSWRINNTIGIPSHIAFFPTEASARAALVAAVMEAIGDE